VTGCLIGCVDPARGLHHTRCPNHVGSAAVEPPWPELGGPIVDTARGSGEVSMLQAIEDAIAEAAADAAAIASTAPPPAALELPQPTPLRLHAVQAIPWRPRSAVLAPKPFRSRVPSARPEPIHAAPAAPSLTVACEPFRTLLADACYRLRKEPAWRPELFLQAREELILAERPDLIADLTRLALESTEAAAARLGYLLRVGPLGAVENVEVDLRGRVLAVPRAEWLNSGAISDFELPVVTQHHAEFYWPLTLTEASPVDIAVELRQKAGYSGPIVLILEAREFDANGNIDIRAPGAVWPDDLYIRSDLSRYIDHVAQESRRLPDAAPMRRYLTPPENPSVLRCAEVTIFRGPREQGYPFLEEPAQVTVLVYAHADKHPIVKTMHFWHREDMEWYDSKADADAVIERLHLLGDVARQDQLLQDESRGCLSVDEAPTAPVLIFGVPGGLNSRDRHPKDAMANMLKHWRRQFRSSFHEVFLCCSDRMGADPAFERRAEQLTNRAHDWHYWRSLRWDEPVDEDQVQGSTPKPIDTDKATHFAGGPYGDGVAGAVGGTQTVPAVTSTSATGGPPRRQVRNERAPSLGLASATRRRSDGDLHGRGHGILSSTSCSGRPATRRRSVETHVRPKDRSYQNWDDEAEVRVQDMQKWVVERLKTRTQRFSDKVRRMQYDLGCMPKRFCVAGKLVSGFGELCMAPDTSQRRSAVGPNLSQREIDRKETDRRTRWETRQWLAGKSAYMRKKDVEDMRREATVVAFVGADDFETRLPKEKRRGAFAAGAAASAVSARRVGSQRSELSEPEEDVEGGFLDASIVKTRPDMAKRRAGFAKENMKEVQAFEHSQVRFAMRTIGASAYESTQAQNMKIQDELHQLAACIGPRLEEQRRALRDGETPSLTPRSSARV